MGHHYESLTVVHFTDLGNALVLRSVARVRDIAQAARINEVKDRAFVLASFCFSFLRKVCAQPSFAVSFPSAFSLVRDSPACFASRSTISLRHAESRPMCLTAISLAFPRSFSSSSHCHCVRSKGSRLPGRKPQALQPRHFA